VCQPHTPSFRWLRYGKSAKASNRSAAPFETCSLGKATVPVRRGYRIGLYSLGVECASASKRIGIRGLAFWPVLLGKSTRILSWEFPFTLWAVYRSTRAFVPGPARIFRGEYAVDRAC
jgi:hypothetical protein